MFASGLVLAAGSSTRLGQPKQLLPFRGAPLLSSAVAVARSAGLDEVVVVLGAAATEVREQVEIDAGYASYLDRQAVDAQALRQEEALTLSPDLDYDAIGGLSNEVREKLARVRPRTLGQAGRIEGVTPGALTALLAHVRRSKSAAAA